MVVPSLTINSEGATMTLSLLYHIQRLVSSMMDAITGISFRSEHSFAYTDLP